MFKDLFDLFLDAIVEIAKFIFCAAILMSIFFIFCFAIVYIVIPFTW